MFNTVKKSSILTYQSILWYELLDYIILWIDILGRMACLQLTKLLIEDEINVGAKFFILWDRIAILGDWLL